MRTSGVQGFKGSRVRKPLGPSTPRPLDPSTPRPLDPSRFLSEAKRLIRMRSVTTESNVTIARYVGRLLKREGFRVRYQTKRMNGAVFHNVVGMKGKGNHPLILMTHLDTVPPGPHRLWTKTGKNPWNPRLHKNRLYGLGSADTKLDILAKIFAARGIAVRSLKRPLMIVGTYGEERGLLGARTFCQRMKHLRGVAFVSEPTGLSWVYEHRGYLVLEVSIPLEPVSSVSPKSFFEMEAIGKSAHSGTPEKGRNAIRLAFDFLKRISLRDPKLKLLFIEGGSTPNQVPGEARLRLAASLGKIPRHPFVKVRRKARKGQKRSKSRRVEEVPWKALLELFEAVDQGIRERRHSMTSTVGMVRQKKKTLKVYVDFRIHPKDKIQEVHSFFQKRIEKVLRWHRLRSRFRIDRDGFSLSIPPRHSIVQLVRRVCRKAGEPFRLIQKPTCTEAGVLWKQGIPALVYGPGKALGNIHAPNEYNDLRQLGRAERFYRMLIQQYCVEE